MDSEGSPQPGDLRQRNHDLLHLPNLLNRAAHLGKYVVGVRPDEANCANDDYQNHSQHDCIFCNVLTTLIVPKML